MFFSRVKVLLCLTCFGLVIFLSSCNFAFGTIKIKENFGGTNFTIEMKDYSSESKIKMQLQKGSVIEVLVSKSKGEIEFIVNGRGGSNPYTSNNLETNYFTFTVAETDEYIILLKGKKASAKIIINNLGIKEK